MSPLVAYGLAGLRRCWMPDRGTWSHKYHLDGRAQPNESIVHSDLYYSLNVLLGLSQARAAAAGEPYDLPRLMDALCSAARAHPVRNGAWGMALWAAAQLDLAAPAVASSALFRLADDPAPASRWTAQDLGLSISGACAQARRDPSWRPLARSLLDILMTRFSSSGALFRDGRSGPRRYFGTFATQIYAGLALYHAGNLFEDERALAAADALVRKLIALQGAHGEWAWFYRPGSDRILDPFEVYSVHQHGMAPALLHHATDRGVPGAREAIETGFRWVFGRNVLQRSMLVPELQLIYRSQARAGLRGRRPVRLLRAAVAAVRAGDPWSVDPAHLVLTQEMRSYEFGWLLWSFGARNDYPDLTHHPAFALRPSQSVPRVAGVGSPQHDPDAEQDQRPNGDADRRAEGETAGKSPCFADLGRRGSVYQARLGTWPRGEGRLFDRLKVGYGAPPFRAVDGRKMFRPCRAVITWP